jgi:hypothetical protein
VEENHDAHAGVLFGVSVQRMNTSRLEKLGQYAVAHRLTNSIFRRTRAYLLLFFTASALIVATFSPAYSESAHERPKHTSSAVPAESSKPAPGVSFSQQMVTENDSVYVQTWLPNDTDNDFTEVSLEIFGPEFMEWHDRDCSGPPITNPFPLEAPTRYTFVEHRLCTKLKTNSEIKVGDFNILFVYHYQWKDGNTLKKSASSVEKPLKVVLLGDDNIVGIPLGLAGLVIPGLFFWFAVSLWKAPWGVGLALGENLFYSMIVSAIFVAIGSWLPHTSWLPQMDVLNGISLGKLARLAATGMVVGTIMGGVDQGARLYRRKQRLARTIKPDDPSDVMLEKLLNTNPDKKLPKTTVRLKDNTEYTGSLGVQTDDITLVVGWFAVPLSGFPSKLSKQVKRYAEENRLADILELARSKNIRVELNSAVKKQDGEGTGKDYMSWRNDQVAEFKIEPETGPDSPLVLK